MRVIKPEYTDKIERLTCIGWAGGEQWWAIDFVDGTEIDVLDHELSEYIDEINEEDTYFEEEEEVDEMDEKILMYLQATIDEALYWREQGNHKLADSYFERFQYCEDMARAITGHSYNVRRWVVTQA